nr:hypothetical protein [Tanacetum cinerariifolium]
MNHAVKVLSMQEDKPEVQEAVDVVTTAKLITEVVTAASTSVSAASTIIPDAEPKVPAATPTVIPIRVAAASTRKRKRVVIRDPEKESTAKILAETKSKDKGKGIMHMKQKAKKDPYVQRYQVMKKRHQTEAQARRNMIMYLKNTAGFRLDYFKGMSYDDIRPIFEAKFNSNIEFLLKSNEQIEEEENRAIESINETLAQKAAKMRKLNEEVKDVEDLKQHLKIMPDKDDDVFTEATPLARKVPVVDYQIIYIVKERFFTSKPNNFSDDYLLTTLRAMFGRTDRQDQVWKSQRSVHGQAMVISWKLLESYGVHIISFTTTQLILLVERRYLLSKFTLDQMLNAIRLQVEEHKAAATLTGATVIIAAVTCGSTIAIIILAALTDSLAVVTTSVISLAVTGMLPLIMSSKNLRRIYLCKDIRLDYFKGMSYDETRPIFEAKFNSNIEFLLKIKERLEEEENKAIQSINETPAQKAAKRRKLNEEVKDLKQHLEIVPDEGDDVYTEATPLAKKVPVVDYKIIHFNNKPHYKIIRADETHQLYVSFLTLLKNFDREDLESL